MMEHMNSIYGLPQIQQPCFPPFLQWNGSRPMLSPPECKAIIDLGESKTLTEGTVGNGDNHSFRSDKQIRCVKTCALTLNDGLEWLFHRLAERAALGNRDFYRFDLSGLQESIVFLRYDTPENEQEAAGHYSWHQDFGGGYSSNRKLSMVVQLSEATEYDGCELHMFTDCDFVPPCREAGDAIMFPSWTPHMVSPITRGTRYALAVWVSGPQFR